MVNDSDSFWRFRHSQATYVGQLEGRAAREELASAYEWIWHDSFVNGHRNYTMVNGDGSHGLGRLFAQWIQQNQRHGISPSSEVAAASR